MTARADRRRRRTVVVAVSSVVMVLAAAALFVVGVVTLSNSQEGEAVGVDERPIVRFPSTPNGVFAIAAATGELASVAVLTLLPDGQGGSVVPLPASADTTSGLGGTPVPLTESFDRAAVGPTRDALEAMLVLSVERIEVVDAQSLGDFLPPFETLDVVLATDADDISRGGPARIAEAGPAVLTRAEAIELLTSIDPDADPVGRYENEVAVWTSIASLADPTPSGEIDLDEAGRPVPPPTMLDLADRLWSGPTGARGLQVSNISDDDPDEPTATLLDRADTTLTFAQISPALVSTPNVGSNLRIEANFDDEQLRAGGIADAEATELLRDVVARMIFLQANVVSVESGSATAPPITIVEVANEGLVEDSEAAGPLLFGEVEVRVAETVLEGVDVVVTLGASYLDFQAERRDGDDDAVDVPPFLGGTADTTTPPDTVVDDE